MKSDFKFIKDNNKLLKIGMKLDGKVDNCRGFACFEHNIGFVNLCANQWKLFSKKNECELIKEICKTLVHETLHLELNTNLIGEEMICQKLASQIKERGLENKKNETFIY